MSNPQQASAWIFEADQATFQQQAVERSRELPVVIDFWATWCQPCQVLAPLLEKLAVEYAGKFLLVKAETEKVPDIAAGFGVQSIPAVYAMRDGELVDFFVGLKSEPQLRAWLDRILPTPAETLLLAARKLRAGDATSAEAKLTEALALDPNLAKAKIELIGLLAEQGRHSPAAALLEQLEQRGFLEPEAERLKSQLDVAMTGSQAGDVESCRAALSADPNNLQLQLRLSQALAAAAGYQEALDLALKLVQVDKQRFGEQARKIMVDIFHLLPSDSELTSTYRRRLSTALY